MTTKEEVLRLCDEVGIYKTYDDAAGAEVWVADLRELTELIEIAKAQGAAEEKMRIISLIDDKTITEDGYMIIHVTNLLCELERGEAIRNRERKES